MKTEKISKQMVFIILVITAVFLISSVMFVRSGSYIRDSYTENATDLASSHMVQMVNDTLDTSVTALELITSSKDIKEWAGKGNDILNSPATEREFCDSIARLCNLYQVTCIYVSFQDSSRCYSQRGMERILSRTEPEDGWYFDLMDGTPTRKIRIIMDIFHPYQKEKVVMVTQKITDQTGKVVGCVSVSTSVLNLEGTLRKFSNDYDMDSCFINANGDVLLSSGLLNSDAETLFAEGGVLSGQRGSLHANPSEIFQKWVSGGAEGNDRELCIVRYDQGLDLFLVIVNQNERMNVIYRKQMAALTLILLILFVSMIFLVIFIIRNYRSQIIRLATTDELTGLMNRKSFVKDFERLRKEKKLNNAVALLLDIDFFKKINDSFGHAAGDQALSFVAGKVKETVGSDGICGRWGGDEFIALIPDTGQDIKKQINGLMKAISESEPIKDVHISVSIGVVQVHSYIELNQAVEYADEALYVSKKNGRGCLNFYEENVTPKVHYSDRDILKETEKDKKTG